MEIVSKAKADCKIIPIPKEVEYFDGTITLPINIYTEKLEWEPITDVFCQSVKKIFNVDTNKKPGSIELVYNANIESDAYSIKIDEKVVVYASSYEGASYGIVSVLQLATCENENFVFERLNIFDKPDKDYRGFMVDIGREWHPFEELLKFVDLCYFFKTKYFHIHFMDMPGYAFPSKAFPKLSLKGNTYTFEQIEYLCKYAKDRGVKLIPEIEMPGHVTVLNKTYPELFSNKLDRETESLTIDVGALDNSSVLCPGSKIAFESIKTLIDEVIEMLGDLKYIHLGGDEVNTAVWKSCSVCREYMKEHGIDSVEELYAEFLGRVTDYVLSKGITPIIWEGFAKEYSHYISKDVIVIAWETMYQTPQNLLENGFKIINGSWKPLYIVPPYMVAIERKGEWGIKEILDWNLYEWQNWYEKAESTLNPIHIQPTDDVLGGQVSSWCQTYEEEISFAVRFLSAAMERIWSVKRFRKYETFTRHHKIQSAKAFRLII